MITKRTKTGTVLRFPDDAEPAAVAQRVEEHGGEDTGEVAAAPAGGGLQLDAVMAMIQGIAQSAQAMGPQVQALQQTAAQLAQAAAQFIQAAETIKECCESMAQSAASFGDVREAVDQAADRIEGAIMAPTVLDITAGKATGSHKEPRK